MDEEARLVERAKSDPESLSLLYRQNYAAIAGYVQKRVGRCSDAEDITSEVFLEMVRGLPRYKQRGVPFRAWLYRIAASRISRWARKQRVTPHQAPASQATCESNDDIAETVRQALLSLSVRHQAVVSLHYLEDMSVAEIAEVLSIREGTVKSRLSRAREILKPILVDRGILS